jgi:dihydrofolate synthase/folylpolyglutamate synthase
MDIESAYQKALDYLYSFVDFSLTHQQNLAPENFDLTRMYALQAALDDSHLKYPIIHVAGTKGKGSVSAFCATVLQAAGYKTGLFTSPHLKDFEERIQINGEPIPRPELVALVEEIKPFVAEIPKLTTFEISTALGFWYFARQGVDVAVIEVGLGGRLDSTNVVNPEVAVITSISHDHTFVLGDTLEEIATEKAGIIKYGKPVVLGPQQSQVVDVVKTIAAEQEAPFTQIGEDYNYKPCERSLDGQSFCIWRKVEGEDAALYLNIPLLGLHQIENAATAYAALDVFRKYNLPFTNMDIQEGFSKTNWPARFEILRREPPVVVDSAHNSYSAKMLRQTLEDYFPNQPVILVIGVSADKDVEGMFRELQTGVKAIITTQSNHPRAMHPEELAAVLNTCGCQVQSFWKPHAALEEALRLALQENALVLGTGSLFLAASLRIAWFKIIDEM